MDAIKNPVKFRNELMLFIDNFPELFPNGIKEGCSMKEIRIPQKTGIPTRRILVDGIAYTGASKSANFSFSFFGHHNICSDALKMGIVVNFSGSKNRAKNNA